MNDRTKEKYLKVALVAFGIVLILVYPLSIIWPSGWVWHNGQGVYYLQMMCVIYAVLGGFLIAAAKNPSAHRSLISFTIWSSAAHAALMIAQMIDDGNESGHLVGDIPSLFLVAGVLWYLSSGLKSDNSPA